MGNISSRLIVFFEEPFWIGVFERVCDGKLSVAKVTFGAEPMDYEIQEFIIKHYYNLQFYLLMMSYLNLSYFDKLIFLLLY